jgi:glycine oxidase
MRPPRLLRALLAVVHGSVRGNEAVRELILEGSRVSGVRTISGTWLAAEEVVVCAGCWSGPLLRVVLGRDLPVRPLRGQIACLDSPGAPPGQTPLLLGEGSHYLIPRADGRVLAGSTFEDVGFDERVTADGLRDVLDGAIAIAPGLARASVAASWAGLRPGTPDGLPFLGRVTDGLTVATGHFRDGLLLTPVTAEIVACLLERRPPPVDLEPYRADRDRGQPPGNTENVAMSYAV